MIRIKDADMRQYTTFRAGGHASELVICDTREELAEYLGSILQQGDAVLFKGSRGMKLEEVVAALE